MRSLFTRLLVVVLAASGLMVAGPGGSATEVDLAVGIKSVPPVVSPSTAENVYGVIYEVTATNDGAAPGIDVELTVDLAAGFEFVNAPADKNCDVSGDPESGQTVTCEFFLLLGSEVFDIVANVPSMTGTYLTEARISSALDPFEADTTNNEATATTEVTDSVAGGLVPGGGSITLDVGDGRSYTLQVPESAVNGVIVSIAPEDGRTDCAEGGVDCGPGFHTEFDTREQYQADDPADPIITTKTFGKLSPCRGIGGGSSCTDILWEKFRTATVLRTMEHCEGYTGGDQPGFGKALPNGDPCINQKFKDDGGNVWFDVRMISTDPIELPPILG